MEFLTLINILEPVLSRNAISTKNSSDAISYRGNINTLTINTDTYVNPSQIIITHDINNLITVSVNHLTRRHTTDYELTTITNVEVS